MSSTLDLRCFYRILTDNSVTTGVSISAPSLPAASATLYEYSSLVDRHGPGRYAPRINELDRRFIEQDLLPHSAEILACAARIVAQLSSAMSRRDGVVVSLYEIFELPAGRLSSAEGTLGDSFYTWFMWPTEHSKPVGAHFRPPDRNQEIEFWALLDREDFLAPLRYESLRASLQGGD